MCTIKELHQKMTDIVAVKANEAGGRINLARKIGCSDRLVHGILDRVEYPSKKSFELWFGPMTDFDGRIDESELPMAGLLVNDNYVEPKDDDPLPFIVRCPEYENLSTLLTPLGYMIRITKK